MRREFPISTKKCIDSNLRQEIFAGIKNQIIENNPQPYIVLE